MGDCVYIYCCAYVYANHPGSVSQTRDDIPVQVWLGSGVRYTGGTWDICVGRKGRAEVVELRNKEFNYEFISIVCMVLLCT